MDQTTPKWTMDENKKVGGKSTMAVKKKKEGIDKEQAEKLKEMRKERKKQRKTTQRNWRDFA